jgi:hypothetical protein
MAELFKNVKPGQRCLFYAIRPGQTRDTAIKDAAMFRANVVQIINNRTLNINNLDCKEYCVYQTPGTVSMPLGWILKIETLDDIVCEKLLIPSEIILEIDLFA